MRAAGVRAAALRVGATGAGRVRPWRDASRLTGWLAVACAGIVGDIRASMLDEVDFTKEAQHIQQVR